MAQGRGWWSLLLPLRGEQRRLIEQAQAHLEPEDLAQTARLLKRNLIAIDEKRLATSIVADRSYPQLRAYRSAPELDKDVARINTIIEQAVYAQAMEEFAKRASERMPALIAPSIVGLEAIKQAAALQLFASEPTHLLLLGDPGTGKTEILRSVEELAPIASFGLGSGTSGAGLAVTVTGKEVTQGLLPSADRGICCIDELNLMKPRDMAALYNAMEKGFITYNKGSQRLRFDARVRVLATANPKGDRFVGKSAQTLREQLPFDSALLSRFHLVFVVRKPSREELKQITRSIVRDRRIVLKKADVAFIKRYISTALRVQVAFDKAHEKVVVRLIEQLAEDEPHFIVEVGPRLVVGAIRLAKAAARQELREKVTGEDLAHACDLLKASLYWRRAPSEQA